MLLINISSLVPYICAPCQRPRRNQRRTKEGPKNSETQKSTFVKIAVSFSSLIPSLKIPTNDRENSERTPTELPVTKMSVLLRFPFL